MQQFKFRGVRIDNGKWVYGYFIKDKADKCFIIKFDSLNERFTIPVHEESVGQYTGLKDKNGKGIFEGDILRGDFGNSGGGKSKYRSFNFSISAHVTANHSKFGIDMPSDYGDFRFHPYISDCEIIGNIYEHSYLLSGSNAV